MIIPEIALVTAIKGVWSDGVTDQTTKYPKKMANMKIPILLTNAESVIYEMSIPIPTNTVTTITAWIRGY